MKEIKITSNGIKQAIDDLVNENEMLQDKIYKLEDTIKEAIEYLEQPYRDNFDFSKARLLEILDKGENNE